MAKKSPTEFIQPQWPHGYKPFKPRDIERILDRAKVKSAAHDREDLREVCRLLNHGAQRLRYHREIADQPTEAEYAKFVAQLQKHIAALQAMLPLVDEHGWRPRVAEGVSHIFFFQMMKLLPTNDWTNKLDTGFLRAGPDDILLFFVRTLQLLSESVSETVARYDAPRQVRQVPPMQHFGAVAAVAYLDLTDSDKLSMSRNPETKAVGGPLIRFVEACCVHIGEEVPRERLALWIRGWRRRWKGRVGLFKEGEDSDDVEPDEIEDLW